MQSTPPLRRGLRWSLALCVALALASTRVPGGAQGRAGPPDESRFTRRVLVEGLDEPIGLELDARGRAYLVERATGELKRFDEATGQVAVLGSIPVFSGLAHHGLIGLLLDRDFATSRAVFLVYSAPGESREVHLSRFTLGADDRLAPASEKLLMRWRVDAADHLGGSMTWDARGNLYLTTGDNSPGPLYGALPANAEGAPGQDAQRTAANSNDLRGKILRIHPEPDGSYTIPAGNLFAPGTPNARPEIYVMGNRNPWHLSIDSRTGFLHWGDPGPDATRDSAGVGPMGYDEFNVARAAGNFGWPYFIGANRAYNRYDYAAHGYAEPFDPAHPVNLSPSNTGVKDLPPAQPALIAYRYVATEEYPAFGTGGHAAAGGPIFHRANFRPDAKRLFPAYYEGTWFVYDYVRGWIVAVRLDEQSRRVVSAERILPSFPLASPLDVEFGPEGDLYVLEYARKPGGRLVRFEYNAGNRAPNVKVSSSAPGGRVPFTVKLSSEGTADPDGDALRLVWTVTQGTGAPRTLTGARPDVSFDRPGVYTATLTARDPAGATTSRSLRIVAGNEPPRVAVDLATPNRTFYFPGQPIAYSVRVTDAEDAAVAPERVAVSVDYAPEGFDTSAVRQGDRPVDATTRFAVAQAIMGTTDCRACHNLSTPRLVGPSFQEIAAKYQGADSALSKLVAKVRAGGSGVWGALAMPPHPALSVGEASALVRYVLASGSTPSGGSPLSGSYLPEVPQGDAGRGPVIVHAAYTDGGAGGVPALTGEAIAVRRSPLVAAGSADLVSGVSRVNRPNGLVGVAPTSGGQIGFRGIDLTGIRQLELAATVVPREGTIGGRIEVRLDSPTGKLLGQVTAAPAQPGGGGGQGGPQPLRVELSEAGTHDLYLLFRNETARPMDALMTLNTLRFVP